MAGLVARSTESKQLTDWWGHQSDTIAGIRGRFSTLITLSVTSEVEPNVGQKNQGHSSEEIQLPGKDEEVNHHKRRNTACSMFHVHRVMAHASSPQNTDLKSLQTGTLKLYFTVKFIT